ncbi:hypothetical protein J1N35_036556 [Gossypium stocksii]|uniref:Uncharacterized protein n=1 Tax=Gossypium stocksii TaxID=47602 RepID=A0A9D3UII6_9ROSI|nr:hypothetical protein J1N35_036556 [Gossypium stocksii]
MTASSALRTMNLLGLADSLVEDLLQQMMILALELVVLLVQPSCLLVRCLLVDNMDPDTPPQVKLPGLGDSAYPDMPPRVTLPGVADNLQVVILVVDSADPDMPLRAHLPAEDELHLESDDFRLCVDCVEEILVVNGSYLMETLVFHTIPCLGFLDIFILNHIPKGIK